MVAARNNTITRENIKAAKRPDELTGHTKTRDELLQFFGIVRFYYKGDQPIKMTDERRLTKFNSLS